MALSSGRLVTSIISPLAGKGEPDCSKTKITVHYALGNIARFHSSPSTEMGKDLNFASYVLYNLPVLCHVSRTVSLGYLWFNIEIDLSNQLNKRPILISCICCSSRWNWNQRWFRTTSAPLPTPHKFCLRFQAMALDKFWQNITGVGGTRNVTILVSM